MKKGIMKTEIMKKGKLLSLVLLTVMTFSCSSNDEDNLESSSIVGTWKPVKEVDVCSTGKEDVYELTSCEQESRFIFKLHTNQSLKSDGTVTANQKSLDNGECKSYYNETGTWSLNGNEIEITIGNETSKPTFFELNSNIMRIGNYDNDSRNPPCDGGNLTSHYYTEYVRVN